MIKKDKGQHVFTIKSQQYLDSIKEGGCGECQTSCQSACKTSCTVGNQTCEKVRRPKSK